MGLRPKDRPAGKRWRRTLARERQTEINLGIGRWYQALSEGRKTTERIEQIIAEVATIGQVSIENAKEIVGEFDKAMVHAVRLTEESRPLMDYTPLQIWRWREKVGVARREWIIHGPDAVELMNRYLDLQREWEREQARDS